MRAPAPAGVAELAAVYRDHFDFVWRNARRLGAAEDWVDDATHEVFLVVALRLDEFRYEAQLRTWLFAITHRVVARMGRDRFRRADRLRQHLSESTMPTRAEPSMDEERTLRQLLLRLSEPKRVAFILAELEGMTSAEVAGYLGVPVGTVDTRLRAARLELRQLLARELDLEQEGAR